MFSLSVQSISSGTAELGVDTGGQTTEYSYYLMKELEWGNLHYDLVSGNMMNLVGGMILHSILNNCRWLSGLSPAVVTYVVSATRDTVLEKLDTQDVPD